jgi:hypothetical protein
MLGQLSLLFSLLGQDTKAHLGTKKPLKRGVKVLRSSKDAIKEAKALSLVFKLDLIGPNTYAPKCLIDRKVLESVSESD